MGTVYGGRDYYRQHSDSLEEMRVAVDGLRRAEHRLNGDIDRLKSEVDRLELAIKSKAPNAEDKPS